MYICNTPETKVDESLLTSLYSRYWPNLNIYAKYIQESYIAKFVQVSPDSGKEQELKSYKLSTDTVHPNIPLDLAPPSRTNYDFIGWALSPDATESSQLVLEYVKNNDGTFTYDEYFDRDSAGTTFNENTNTVITLYAIFIPHPYIAQFDILGDGNYIDIATPYSMNRGINGPLEIPHKPYDVADTELNSDGELGLYRTYKFMGWAAVGDAEQTIVDLSTFYPNKEGRKFVAIYDDVSVYDNVADEKYFLIVNNNLQINAEYYGVLSGKVTIPATINGQKYTGIGSFGGSNNSAITHIFFARSDNGSTPTSINTSALGNLIGLVYFEMPSSVSYIGSAAFAGCSSLGSTDDSSGTLIAQMFATQKTIESNAFSENVELKTLDLGTAPHIISSSAFSALRYLKRIIIGSPSDLSSLSLADLDNGTGHIFGNLTGRLIGVNEGSVEIFLASGDPVEMFESFDFRSDRFLLTAHS